MTEKAILIFLGLAAGAVTAAGVFAFLIAIGLVQRLADKTHTASRMKLYENCFALGGTLGNLADLYRLPLPGGRILCLALGLFCGIFVGCLIMSLAETLQVVPVVCRRIRLTKGLPWILLAFGAGKTAGSLLFFWMSPGG